MSTIYKKAPLIELIAELRWIPAGITPQQAGTVQVLFTNDAKVEEFFMRLGGELYQSGFQRSERLVPPGFPIVFGQPAIRYRSDDAVKKSVLYQAGSSIFSVHAVPPYRSWDNFLPEVKKGVEALLKTRGDGQEQSPFTQLTLRYLDFFGEELLGGRSMDKFIADVMGFSVNPPSALTKVAAPQELRSVFLKFVVPVEAGTLSVSVGDGKANNQQSGVVLDTIFTSTAPIEPKFDNIIAMFNTAHDVIKKTFLTFTAPIEHLMEPEKAENQ
jgi:uncharacterized protein (TIGR04255 family)